MDLSRLDTRQKASEGVDVPLVVNGETMISDIDGQPVTFRVKGLTDPEVHKLVLQGRRAAQRTPEEVVQADLKLARAAVIGWSENFKLDGEIVKFTRQNIDKVFSVPLIRRAILAEIFDDRIFMNGA